MQAKVEKLHRAWPKNHNYLAPPTVGKLADIDPALIVKPPKGLEIGYMEALEEASVNNNIQPFAACILEELQA